MRRPRYVANPPTKRHWRDPLRIEDGKAGLVALAEDVVARTIWPVAAPARGAGLGGLEWDDGRPKIEWALGSLDGVRVLVREPRTDRR